MNYHRPRWRLCIVEVPGDNLVELSPPDLAGLDGGTSRVDRSVLVPLPFNGNCEECGEGCDGKTWIRENKSVNQQVMLHKIVPRRKQRYARYTLLPTYLPLRTSIMSGGDGRCNVLKSLAVVVGVWLIDRWSSAKGKQGNPCANEVRSGGG